MIEVFITDVRERNQAKEILASLKASFPELDTHIDLSNSDTAFPCGHSVLRVEGPEIDVTAIISAVGRSGFRCDVLEDKVCQS